MSSCHHVIWTKSPVILQCVANHSRIAIADTKDILDVLKMDRFHAPLLDESFYHGAPHINGRLLIPHEIRHRLGFDVAQSSHHFQTPPYLTVTFMPPTQMIFPPFSVTPLG